MNGLHIQFADSISVLLAKNAKDTAIDENLTITTSCHPKATIETCYQKAPRKRGAFLIF